MVFLGAFRIGLNVADSNVIDVGYAGVIGADRIVDGDPLYGPGFSDDVERGDTYGPLTYLLYVPFEQALPWSGAWDDLPAAHGAAIAFDLLVLGGLLLLGRRLRPGRDGLVLGAALAWAWVAYPYTAFALETNSNDTLVALACVVALLAATVRREALGGAGAWRGDRRRRGGQVRPAGAGAAVRARRHDARAGACRAGPASARRRSAPAVRRSIPAGAPLARLAGLRPRPRRRARPARAAVPPRRRAAGAL